MASKVSIKGYQIGAKLDQWGLKTIYRALHISSGKEVFLTVMTVRPGRALDALLRRARLSRKLRLPNLTTAIDFGQSAQEHFYFTHRALPSFPIQDLLQRIQDEQKRTSTLLSYVQEVLEVLDYLHRAKTSHRDLQTAQIRVDTKDRVVLEGYINPRPKVEGRNIINMVHLPYMSPEQLKGGAADAKGDLYAVGVILYELVTGQLPHSSNYAKIEDARQGIIPSPSRLAPNIDPVLDRIIMKALAPRSSRYRHAQEMLDDLQLLQRRQSIWLRVKELGSQLRRWMRLPNLARAGTA
jgi:serine/threonine protein kinase